MALPTPTKTWRFAHVPIAAGANQQASARNFLFAQYNALSGRNADDSGDLTWLDEDGNAASAPSVLWERKGECDGQGGGGSFVNNSSTQKIGTAAEFVSAATGSAHAWWHKYNSATGAHLLFTYRDGNGGTYLNIDTAHAWMMSLAGFGSANGGADGTATARPTATDEVGITVFDARAITAGGNLQFFAGVAGAAVAHMMHVMASTDGKEWRILLYRNGYSINTLMIGEIENATVIDGSSNALNGANKPVFGIVHCSENDFTAGRSLQDANWMGQTNARVAVHMANADDDSLTDPKYIHMTCETMNGLRLPRQNKSDLTNAWTLNRIGLVSNNTGYKGPVGRIADVWFGPDVDLGVAEGDTMPVTGEREFLNSGPFVFQWDTTVPDLS